MSGVLCATFGRLRARASNWPTCMRFIVQRGSVECVSLAVVFLCPIPWLEFTYVGKSRADLADIVVSVGAS